MTDGLTPLRDVRSQAQERLGKPGEDREVGVKLYAFQAAHTQGGESVLSLQVGELALDQSAAAVERAEPLGVARYTREQPAADPNGQDWLLALRNPGAERRDRRREPRTRRRRG
jgi:hypothetical protein